MEKTINLEKKDVTTLTDPKTVLNKTSEFELLESAILFVPQGGHASNEIIQLSAVYARLKTMKDKAKGKTITATFDEKEMEIIKKQISQMRWTVMSPVIIDFINKFSD